MIELYDGGRFFREGKRISYEPNQCLATKVRKRKSLKAYLVIPKVVLGSKTQINIFGTASTATVDILIYEAGNKISSKTLTLLRDEVTSMEITDLISKSRKDKSCKDYRIEIQKSKRNYTLNNSFHFKL